MGSDKRPPLVISKAACPSALEKKNVLLKNLKIEYYNNTRAWMNGPIFHSYMKNWNDELARQRRHILLLIDNAPSHIVDEYSNIKIQFLPPNNIQDTATRPGYNQVCKVCLQEDHTGTILFPCGEL